MADEKNVTLEQLKSFMTKADERLDKLEVGKENKVSPVSITIPTEGWASEEPVGQRMLGAEIIGVNIKTSAVYSVERGAVVVRVVDLNAP